MIRLKGGASHIYHHVNYLESIANYVDYCESSLDSVISSSFVEMKSLRAHTSYSRIYFGLCA